MRISDYAVSPFNLRFFLRNFCEILLLGLRVLPCLIASFRLRLTWNATSYGGFFHCGDQGYYLFQSFLLFSFLMARDYDFKYLFFFSSSFGAVLYWVTVMHPSTYCYFIL